MAFGKRKFQRIISHDLLISLPITELKMASVGMETEPKLRFKRNIPNKAKLKNKKSILFF
jgi:hypothetical protein